MKSGERITSHLVGLSSACWTPYPSSISQRMNIFDINFLPRHTKKQITVDFLHRFLGLAVAHKSKAPQVLWGCLCEDFCYLAETKALLHKLKELKIIDLQRKLTDLEKSLRSTSEQAELRLYEKQQLANKIKQMNEES